MPRHKQVTTCRRSGGPLSKMCTCEHCCLDVCSICGAWEGSLTTDCPDESVSHDRRQEVYETNLDYTDERGWYMMPPGDSERPRRSPRFENTKLSPTAPRQDPRAMVAPSIDWAAVDRTQSLQHELTLKAIAWVLADRVCEDRAANERLAQEAAAPLHGKAQLDDHDLERLAVLERLKIDFRMACWQVERCDDEFRQVARKLVEWLEQGVRSKSPTDQDG